MRMLSNFRNLNLRKKLSPYVSSTTKASLIHVRTSRLLKFRSIEWSLNCNKCSWAEKWYHLRLNKVTLELRVLMKMKVLSIWEDVLKLVTCFTEAYQVKLNKISVTLEMPALQQHCGDERVLIDQTFSC